MKAHFLILGIITLVILFCAAFNSYEEELPTAVFYMGTVVASIVPSILGMAAFFMVTRLHGISNWPLCVASYMISITGMLAYTFYAANGKADSLHSSGHMHVIMFPVVYGFLAVFMIAFFWIISYIIKLSKI
ncbi:MAG: hypothetical protein V4640_16575 [Verrucomicrobiota bacterium]